MGAPAALSGGDAACDEAQPQGDTAAVATWRAYAPARRGGAPHACDMTLRRRRLRGEAPDCRAADRSTGRGRAGQEAWTGAGASLDGAECVEGFGLVLGGEGGEAGLTEH